MPFPRSLPSHYPECRRYHVQLETFLPPAIIPATPDCSRLFDRAGVVFVQVRRKTAESLYEGSYRDTYFHGRDRIISCDGERYFSILEA